MKHVISYLPYIQGTIIGILLVIGIGFVSANYTAPVSAPPNCPAGSPGCDAPIHVGAQQQSKVGTFSISGATSFMSAPVGSFREVQLRTHLDSPCNNETAGFMRYNNATIEYCDGFTWKAFSSGNAATSLNNYSQLPTGSIAGVCESDLTQGWPVNRVVEPAFDDHLYLNNTNHGCACRAGWSLVTIESLSGGDDEGSEVSRATYTCIKN